MVGQPGDNRVDMTDTTDAIGGYVEDGVVYPYEDDEPLAESDFQYEPITYMVAALKAFFADRQDVYVAGDMFVYYKQGDARTVVAPDVFAVFGASGNHKRNSWFTWLEGDAVPGFVMEVASDSTWRRDAREKREIYAGVGVDEYWRFDPTGECFTPALIGERLVDGAYEPIAVEQDGDGMLRAHSVALGLDICVYADLELRLYDAGAGVWLPSYDELMATHGEERAAREAAEGALVAERVAREMAESALEAQGTALRDERTARDAAESALYAERTAREVERLDMERRIRELEERLRREG